LGSRAVGGAGLVFTEAAAVTAQGRISPQDAGIWNDTQAQAWRPIVDFIRSQGAVAGIQLAHAGFKGSTHRPWDDYHGAVAGWEGGWQPVGPTVTPFSDDYPTPRALGTSEVAGVVGAFVAAARRALDSGFQVLEVHAAHGYLLHEFLSPLSNTRVDIYGGCRENRMRLPLEVVRSVRAEAGEQVPIFVRISATDWTRGGWDADDSVVLARALAGAGADLIDCSSGGVVPKAEIPVGPGYQVPLAGRIRREAGVPSGAVGMIIEPEQAEQILVDGHADLVLLARELLRDPYWPRRALIELGAQPQWPVQYARAR